MQKARHLLIGAMVKVVDVCIYKCVLSRVEKTVDYVALGFLIGEENPTHVVMLACLIAEKSKPTKQLVVVVR